MADPAAEAIMLCGVDWPDMSPDLFDPGQKVTDQALIQLLASRRGHKPGSSLEKIGVGHFNTGVFFSRHRMPAKKARACAAPEHLRRLRHNLGFGATDIGEQHIRRKRRTETANQFDDGSYGSSQKNNLAASRRCYRIALSGINDSFLQGLLEHRHSITANDLPRKPRLL